MEHSVLQSVILELFWAELVRVLGPDRPQLLAVGVQLNSCVLGNFPLNDLPVHR